MTEQGKAKVRRGRKPRTEWTVGELLDTKVQQAKEVVEGLLPVGLTTLAGRPKIGKSWLALQLAAAVAEGKEFLEQATHGGTVLYLALEDTRQRLKERVEIVGLGRDAPIRFITEWPALSWETGGLGQLEEKVKEVKPRLVVIDTLTRAVPQCAGGVNPGEMVEVIGELQRMAHRQGCAVLAVDHHRKAKGEDVINDILGSTGKSAAIDTAWGVYRTPKGAKLSVRGRDLRETEIRLEWEAVKAPGKPGADGVGAGEERVVGGLWRVSEDGNRLAAERAEGELLRALAKLGGKATAAQLAAEMGKSRQAVEKTGWRMANHDRLIRDWEGAEAVYKLPSPNAPAVDSVTGGLMKELAAAMRATMTDNERVVIQKLVAHKQRAGLK